MTDDSAPRARLGVYVVIALLLTAGVVAAAADYWTPTRNVPLGHDDGTDVIVQCECEVDMSNFTRGSTIVVNSTAGNATVDGAAGTRARLDNIEGSWTTVSEVDASTGDISINPSDKQRVTVGGGLDSIEWQPESATELDDGTVDFRYSATSSANVSIGGLPGDTDVAAIDDQSDEILATSTTNADGRATFQGLSSGDHDIRIRKTPETLYIRDEQTNELLDNVSAEIRFYVDDKESTEVVERQSSDGTVNFTGLPSDAQFVALVDADGYLPRRVYVESLYQQQDMFLLNESAEYNSKVFEYSDYTGRFGADNTALLVQRAINGSWRTVQGDVIGSTGEYRVQLANNVRHRLVVLNTETGERMVLGPYTPIADGAQQIRVHADGEIEIRDVGPIVNNKPMLGVVPAGQTDVTVDVRELDESVSSFNVTAIRENETNSTVLANDSATGAGSLTLSLDLSNMSDSTLVVKTQFEMDSGRSGTRYRNYSINRQFENPNSLLSVAGDVPSLLPAGDVAAFQTMVSVLLSILMAGAVATNYRLSSESIGLVVVLVLAAFSVIGWVQYGLVFASSVAWISFTALRRGI
ncbi:hypothetical protein [Halomicrobium urmianum]|uniref:hypothetical protein n=1 Tax=Halomicrobium urmianum TaxID=1586233 RepID=UPI001CD9E687|nr:hypothetical protein [Halomicrobium urmianum]